MYNDFNIKHMTFYRYYFNIQQYYYYYDHRRLVSEYPIINRTSITSYTIEHNNMAWKSVDDVDDLPKQVTYIMYTYIDKCVYNIHCKYICTYLSSESTFGLYCI